MRYLTLDDRIELRRKLDELCPKQKTTLYYKAAAAAIDNPGRWIDCPTPRWKHIRVHIAAYGLLISLGLVAYKRSVGGSRLGDQVMIDELQKL